MDEMYYPSREVNGAPVVGSVAKFRGKEVVREAGTIWNRRRDLTGVHLKITLFPTPPGLFVPAGDYSKAFGFQIEMVRDLQRMYNFTYELMGPKSGTYGLRSKNGSWDGNH